MPVGNERIRPIRLRSQRLSVLPILELLGWPRSLGNGHDEPADAGNRRIDQFVGDRHRQRFQVEFDLVRGEVGFQPLHRIDGSAVREAGIELQEPAPRCIAWIGRECVGNVLPSRGRIAGGTESFAERFPDVAFAGFANSGEPVLQVIPQIVRQPADGPLGIVLVRVLRGWIGRTKFGQDRGRQRERSFRFGNHQHARGAREPEGVGQVDEVAQLPGEVGPLLAGADVAIEPERDGVRELLAAEAGHVVRFRHCLLGLKRRLFCRSEEFRHCRSPSDVGGRLRRKQPIAALNEPWFSGRGVDVPLVQSLHGLANEAAICEPLVVQADGFGIRPRPRVRARRLQRRSEIRFEAFELIAGLDLGRAEPRRPEFAAVVVVNVELRQPVFDKRLQAVRQPVEPAGGADREQLFLVAGEVLFGQARRGRSLVGFVRQCAGREGVGFVVAPGREEDHPRNQHRTEDEPRAGERPPQSLRSRLDPVAIRLRRGKDVRDEPDDAERAVVVDVRLKGRATRGRGTRRLQLEVDASKREERRRFLVRHGRAEDRFEPQLEVALALFDAG